MRLSTTFNTLRTNFIKKLKTLAVVKAFGYGSDANKVAYFLKDKVDYFAVAYAHEGISLRKAKIPTPVLVLHPQIQNLDEIIRNQLEPSYLQFKNIKRIHNSKLRKKRLRPTLFI